MIRQCSDSSRARRRGIRQALCAALVLLLPAVAGAQGPQLRLDHLTRLSELARESVDIEVPPELLQLAAGFIGGNGPDEAAIKQVISGLKAVYVKSFEFDRDGAYTQADIDAVRSQLTGPWSRVVNMQGRGESLSVYLFTEGAQTAGLAVVVAEPRELTIVNIVGPIDLAALATLAGRFGIPDLPIAQPKPQP